MGTLEVASGSSVAQQHPKVGAGLGWAEPSGERPGWGWEDTHFLCFSSQALSGSRQVFGDQQVQQAVVVGLAHSLSRAVSMSSL